MPTENTVCVAKWSQSKAQREGSPWPSPNVLTASGLVHLFWPHWARTQKCQVPPLRWSLQGLSCSGSCLNSDPSKSLGLLRSPGRLESPQLWPFFYCILSAHSPEAGKPTQGSFRKSECKLVFRILSRRDTGLGWKVHGKRLTATPQINKKQNLSLCGFPGCPTGLWSTPYPILLNCFLYKTNNPSEPAGCGGTYL